jgi:hypothetical protein
MRTARTIALLAALAGGLLLVSPGAAQTPPRGAPDLAAMALAPSDLGRAARIQQQGYVRVRGAVAAYVREYRPGTARVGRKRLLVLQNSVELAPSLAQARRLMRAVPIVFRTLDPDALAAEFERASGGVQVTDVRLGKTARLRAGDRAFAKPIRIQTRRLGALHVVVAFVQVDRVVAFLNFAGLPKVKIGVSHARVLGRALARRMTAGLRPAPTALPAISGTPIVGQTFTARTGTWINQPTRYTYAWGRCDASGAGCTLIQGATARTYTLTPADAGFTLRVAVTARNRHGSATAISAASPAVVGPPVNTALPTISGTVAQGQTLSAAPGTWSGSPTFTYQWRRCDAAGGACVDVVGATAATYLLSPADAGFTIRVAVTATNTAGSASAVSAQTTVVP